LYEATENELQVSGMTISNKKTKRVLEVTSFEIIACPPKSTMAMEEFELKL
jgi:hypothetical protein